jgi:catechol 2,3-dioxygenase-like lactoylglutathione lyase family enzyme
MLTERPLAPVVPVSDLSRARAFYVDKLGLRAARNAPARRDEMVLEGGRGTRVMLERFDKPVPSAHTLVAFEVDDIRAEIRALEGRGVRFEDYDMPGLKTEGHVAQHDGSLAAWMKDPDGNIVCIHQVQR